MGTGGMRLGRDGWREKGWEETTVLGGHLVGNKETSCNENLLESMRLILVRTPCTGGYGACIIHLL